MAKAQPLPPREVLGHAMREALESQADRTQSWLGSAIAAVEGRHNPYSPSLVGSWLRGERDMSPSQVFAAEQVFELEPGTLSRLVGYVPAGTAPATTVPEAIAADTGLTPGRKKSLLAAWTIYRDETAADRQLRS